MDSSEVALQPPQRVTGPFRDVIGYLFDRPDGAHGYALWNDTGNQSATVYRILSRLVAGGWADLRVDDERSGGPQRQIFTLTDVGRTGSRTVLARHRSRRRLTESVDGVRVPHPRADPPPVGVAPAGTPTGEPALAVT